MLAVTSVEIFYGGHILWLQSPSYLISYELGGWIIGDIFKDALSLDEDTRIYNRQSGIFGAGNLHLTKQRLASVDYDFFADEGKGHVVFVYNVY